MPETGIVAIASYVPSGRLKNHDIGTFWGGAGGGEHAVCGPDEDVTTMAVAAVERLLLSAGVSRDAIDLVCFATTSSPYAEQPLSQLVALATGLREDIPTSDHGGSPRAGSTALRDCLNAVEAGKARLGLVVCSDARLGEPGSELEKTLGAGAVALLIGREGTAATVRDSVARSDLFVDRWRADGDRFVREYDPRFHRQFGYGEHVAQILEDLSRKTAVTVGDLAQLVLSQPHRGYSDVVKRLKLKRTQVESCEILDRYGDVGTASAFLALEHALSRSKAGDQLAVVSYGAGGADAFLMKVARPLPATSPGAKSYLTYEQFLKMAKLVVRDEVVPPLSVPPVSPYMWRSRKELLQLVGAKCTQCQTVNFPPTLRRICIKCGAREFTETRIARRGAVHTYCVNHYMPDGFEVPLPFVIADMEDGTRYGALATGLDPGAIKIGDRVRLELRKYSGERGVSTYGYKFVGAA